MYCIALQGIYSIKAAKWTIEGVKIKWELTERLLDRRFYKIIPNDSKNEICTK